MQKNKVISCVITQITSLTPTIRAYDLEAVDGGELPLITAGAHLRVPLTLTSGEQVYRSYSIFSNPLQRKTYSIAVKREDQGRGGSIAIHEHFQVGTLLMCELPNNQFQLHADASPAILIAGGIGITPIFSIAQTLANRGRRFQLHYAGRSKQSMAFIDKLETDFGKALHLYPSDEKKRVDAMHLLADAPTNAWFYACGPEGLLNDIESASRALGIAKDRVQTERFTPEKNNTTKAVTLELVRSQKRIHVAQGQSLLAALRDAGVKVYYDCCVGECGTCAVKIIQGTVDHRDHVLTDAQKAQGITCLCVAQAVSDHLVLDV